MLFWHSPGGWPSRVCHLRLSEWGDSIKRVWKWRRGIRRTGDTIPPGALYPSVLAAAVLAADTLMAGLHILEFRVEVWFYASRLDFLGSDFSLSSFMPFRATYYLLLITFLICWSAASPPRCEELCISDMCILICSLNNMNESVAQRLCAACYFLSQLLTIFP